MSFVIINIFELLAALAGSYYLNKRFDEINFKLVIFLWFTLFVEVVFGWLPTLICGFDAFSFLRFTILEQNSWVYNISIIIKFVFYIYYFRFFIGRNVLKQILNYCVVFFILTSITNLLVSEVFFKMISSYTYILGALFLMVSVMFYFIEVLRSDEILNFKKTLPFYIAIGALVFHLSATPLFIYSKYYSNSKSPGFVEIYQIILMVANIFMYTCYSIGFIVCSRKNKSY